MDEGGDDTGVSGAGVHMDRGGMGHFGLVTYSNKLNGVLDVETKNWVGL